MPREVLEFRVVVASPSDVFDARRAVFDGIYELNRIFEAQKISIRGLGWEEYVTPGIGSGAQNVINEQLLRDYDILIALFGTKLGTPTSNAPSGTVEEIEHAIANTQSPLGQHRVQVYFLDKIDSASSISIDELKRVADFRQELEPRGVLYRLFKSEDELQQEVRVNIQRSILEYLQRHPHQPMASSEIVSARAATATNTENEGLPDQDDGALGLLDLQERAEEAIGAAGIAINRINELIGEIGKGTDEQVIQIEKLSVANSTTKDKKKLINEFASFLETRAGGLKLEASLAREHFSVYAQALISLASLQRQAGDADQYKKDVSALLEAVEPILVTLPQNRTSIDGFKTAVRNLPRITSEFNRSKKLLIEALDECTQLFDQTERSIYELTEKT
jgi:hypothetical protein